VLGHEVAVLLEAVLGHAEAALVVQQELVEHVAAEVDAVLGHVEDVGRHWLEYDWPPHVVS